MLSISWFRFTSFKADSIWIFTGAVTYHLQVTENKTSDISYVVSGVYKLIMEKLFEAVVTKWAAIFH